MAKRRCKGTTKVGKRCRANPRSDTGYCNAHSPREVQESSGFGGSQPGAGRPRNPRVVDVLRERIEAEIDAWLAVLEDGRDAMEAVTIGRGEDAYFELVPDHRIRLLALREAFDRAFGRPRQVLEHSGEDGAPIQINAEAFADPKTRKALDELVNRVADSRSD